MFYKDIGYTTSCATLKCLNGGVCSSCNMNSAFYCECTNLFTGQCNCF